MNKIFTFFTFLFVCAFVFGQSQSNVIIRSGEKTPNVKFSDESSLYLRDNTDRNVLSDIFNRTSSAENEITLFTYDFEDCDDFAVDQFNPCMSIDVDEKKTYSSFSSISFPNIGYEGAFIAFNPSLATPDVSNDPRFAPRPGSTKYGVCVSVEPQEGDAIANSDWFFTPSLKLSKKTKFSFWARSTGTNYGLEKFRVWVKTPDDYSLISGNIPIEAPGEWTEFQYELDESYDDETLRFVIQCVSKDVFMFQFDDLKVTTVITNSIVASQNNFNFIAAGEEKTVAIESNVDWTAESSETWLAVIGGNGSNDGDFKLKAEANTTNTERIAVVTVKHTESQLVETITVSQAAADAPKLDLSTYAITFVATGAEKTIAVESNVSWNASTEASWLTLNNGSGTNNGSFTVTAQANPIIEERVANIKVTRDNGELEKIIVVTQVAASPKLEVSLALAFVAAGEEKTVAVESNVNWNASTEASWLTLNNVSGSDNGSFTVTAQANPLIEERVANIKVTRDNGELEKIIVVTQEAAGAKLELDTSPLTFVAVGEEKTIAVESNVNWTVSTTDAVWLTIDPTSGNNDGEFKLNAEANTTNTERTAVITVKQDGGTLGKTINVTQEATAEVVIYNLTVSPSSLEFDKTGGVKNLEITSNVNWTVVSSETWLSLSIASGSNDASIVVTATENEGLTARTADITITGDNGVDVKVIPVSQSALFVDENGDIHLFTYDFESCEDFVLDQFAPCVTYDGDNKKTYAISETDFPNKAYTGAFLAFNPSATTPPVDNKSHFAPRPGGNKYGICVNVDPQGGLPTANNDWFITPKLKLKHNSKFSFWAKSTISEGADYGNEKFNVYVVIPPEGSEDYIKISGATPIEAPGEWTEFVYELEETYDNTEVRFAIQCVSNDVFIFQIDDLMVRTREVPASISVDPTNLEFIAEGEEKIVSITSNVSWIASSDASWLTFNNESGSDNGSFTVTAQANTLIEERVANIKVTRDNGGLEKIVVATQVAASPKLEVSLALAFVAAGEEKTVAVESNVNWNASTEASWLTLNNGAGTNNGSFTVTAQANPIIEERVANIKVTRDNGELEKIIVVTQVAASPKLEVSLALAFVAAGEEKTVAVESNVNWNVSTEASWLMLNNGLGTNNGSFTVTAQANSLIEERVANIKVTRDNGELEKIIVVTQEAAGAKLELDTSPLTFVAVGEEKTIAVESNVNWTVSTTDAVWLAIDPTSGSNDGEFKLKAEANTTNTERTAVVTVKQDGGTLGKTINVTQEAAVIVAPKLDLDTSPLTFVTAGEEKTIAVESNVNWKATSSETWLTVENADGSNNGSFKLSAPANTGAERTAFVIVKQDGGELEKTINVRQTGSAITYSLEIDPINLIFAVNGEEKPVNVTSNVKWKVESSEQWLTIEPAQGSNNGSFVLKASANNGNIERTASVTVTGENISEPKTIAITQLFATGILESLLSSNINIYPNPSSDYIDISSSSHVAQIQIINLLGEVVFTEVYNNKQIRLSISNLPSAQYVVKVISVDGEISYNKIVKE